VLLRPVSEEVGTALIVAVDRALRRKGFHGPCRDDLLQDIVLWFLQQRGSLAEFPPSDRLVAALASRFLRTKNRLRYVLSRCEPVEAIARLAPASRIDDGVLGIDASLRAGSLPPTAGRLVRLVLRGFSWAEACNELRVAAGSRSFFRKQVRTRF